jgi:lysozyme family protein
MSLFELAIPIVLRHEGGLVDNPADPGGVTNHGISTRWLQSQKLDAQYDLRTMTVEQATALYRKYWWDAYRYGAIAAQAVATKVFDMSVNLGPFRAHKMLQQAAGVTADGILGQVSFDKVNSTSSLVLLKSLQDTLAEFYRGIVANNPTQHVFLAGWLNRAFDRI